jgi:M6 family metalloprotease-like protein
MSLHELARFRDRVVAARFLADETAVLLATASGDLVRLPLDRAGDAGEPQVIGRGYQDVVDVEAGASGQAFVVEASGALLAFSLDAADRAAAEEVAGGLLDPRQLAVTDDGEQLLVAVAGGVDGVVALDRTSWERRIVATDLPGITGIAVAGEPSMLFASGPTWLTALAVGRRGRRTLFHSVRGGGSLTWLVRGRLLAMTERELSRVVVVDVTSRPTPVVGIVESLPSEPILALAAGPEWALVVTRHQVLRARLEEVLRSAVVVAPPVDPVFVGSFAPFVVDPQPAGLTMSDLRLVVADPSFGSTVSTAAPAVGDPPEPVFCAGHEPGWYRIEAVDLSGKVRGFGEVQVSDVVAGFEEHGVWVGAPGRRGGGGAGGWPAGGGAGAGAGAPLTYGTIKPITGTYRVAIVLLDTVSARYSAAEAAATRQTFLDEVVNGVPVGGVLSSTAAYYDEVSYGNLTMTATAFGPYQLAGQFGDYLMQAGVSPPVTKEWEPRPNVYWQAAATAADADIDFTQFDAVVCVLRSVSGTVFAWPWGYGDWHVKVKDGPKNSSVDRTLGFVSMPHDWPTVQPGRLIRATLAHELGHTMRLGDVYPWGGHAVDLQLRELDGWDLMADEDAFPHLTLAHRRMLGWVPDADVEGFDVHTAATSVDQQVTLQPIELRTLASSARRGIEITKGEGWQYLVEYRAAQAGQVGDQALPTNDRVLMTDLATDQWDGAQRRKPLLLQRNDADGDGPVLGQGQDFKERDFVGNDFVVDVTQIVGQQARVHVSYGAGSQPDPCIRPWSTDTWQSPDITVTNARNLSDPKWANVPWDDHLNTVVATVANRGRLDAPGVRVEFWYTDMNLGTKDETWLLLGTGSADIPAGQSRDVPCGTQWRPMAPGHYCLEARVPLYQQPPPGLVVEITELNNRARSNYDRFISKSASAPTRERLTLLVENPFPGPARVTLHVTQTNPLYRTLLGESSFLLDAEGRREVEAWLECSVAIGEPLPDPDLEPYRAAPNDVRIWSTVVPLDDTQDRGGMVLAGVRLRVDTGRATRFDDLRTDADVVSGRVVTVDDGSPVPGGSVMVTVGLADDETTTTHPVEDGLFRVSIAAAAEPVRVYYLPAAGYADASARSR